jgi:ribosomal protein S14
MSESDGPSEAKKSTNKTNHICQVCGDGASIINYGALSCLSCRTFFRRNAFPTKV